MEREIRLVISIDDQNELLCGECFSKRQIFYGSAQTDYKCDAFHANLIKCDTSPAYAFGEAQLKTKRCAECRISTGTKKKHIGEYEEQKRDSLMVAEAHCEATRDGGYNIRLHLR